MSLPVALQLYTVREQLAADFEGTVRQVAEMGYQGVEPAGLDLPVAEMKRIFDKYGLACVSSHVPLATLAADIQGELAKCKELGLKYVVIPYLPEGQRPGDAGYAETIANMKAIGEACKALGMKELYHNHDFEFIKIDGKYALDIMYETIPADILATELDTCWVNVGGEEPAPFVLKYTGRAPVVHLKDFVMKGKAKGKLYELIGIEDDKPTEADEGNAFSFMPVGSGVQDIPAILDAAVKAGAEWVVVEQDQPAKGQTAMESARISREYLRTLGW